MRPVLLGLVFFVACKDKGTAPPPPTAPKQPKVGELAQPGSLRRPIEPAMLGIIVPEGSSLDAVEKLARDRGITDLSRRTIAELDIDAESLAYLAPKLSADERAAVARGAGVIYLETTAADGFAAFKQLAPIAADAATGARGWIVDPHAGSFLTPDELRARNVQSLDVRDLVALHNVTGEQAKPQLDTLGMQRFGLPNLLVPAAAPGEVGRVASLMNAVAQTLAMRGDITAPGTLEIDLAKLDPSWGIAEVRKAGGTGKATVKLRWAINADHGDELVLALEPPTGTGPEGFATLLNSYLGEAPMQLAPAEVDDPELLAAAKQARTELTAKKPYFAKGIPHGERLAIKAPFTADDDVVEWMWVDVYKWQGNELVGTLGNDPAHPMKLQRGSEVTVPLAEIADFIHETADGKLTGGYSVEVFRKRGHVE